MKRELSVGTIIIALLTIAAPARASLIGDSVLIEALFPDLATVVGDDVVLVGTPAAELACPAALGTFEICDTYDGSNLTSLNIEVFSIRQDYGPTSMATYSPAVFNGHRFSDLDFGGGATIIGFVLSTDIAGSNAARSASPPTRSASTCRALRPPVPRSGD